MTKPKKFIFVLMPFENSFDDIYEFGIKQTSLDLNAYAERVDEQIFKESILDRIYNQISKADVIVADMTGRNPNVYYEVGYAHGIGKDVILLTQDADDIPFDLKHFPHIVYNNNIKKLAKDLRPKLDWYLNEHKYSETESLEFGLEFRIDGKQIIEGAEFDVQLGTWYGGMGKMKIDIYNSQSSIFKSKFKVGLEIDEKHNGVLMSNIISKPKPIKPSEGRILYISKEIQNIYPHAYETISYSLIDTFYEKSAFTIDVLLKVFTSIELKEIPFKLNVSRAVAKESF